MQELESIYLYKLGEIDLANKFIQQEISQEKMDEVTRMLSQATKMCWAGSINLRVSIFKTL